MKEQPFNSQPFTGNTRKIRSIDYMPVLFLVAALVFLPTGSESSPLNSLAIVFVSIVLEAIPFMFLGSLVGGFIEAFVSRERMTTFLPRKGWFYNELLCRRRPAPGSCAGF